MKRFFSIIVISFLVLSNVLVFLTVQEVKANSLTILNIRSYPQQGENWTVSFETKGTADLIITSDDQAIIDDLDFVSLLCDNQERTSQAQICGDPLSATCGERVSAGSISVGSIYYPNWQCSGTGQITHLVNVVGRHTLKFQFRDETAYAYNATVTWDGEGTDETCGGQAGDGNKWSCGANWSGDTAPGSGDLATFDATSTKDAAIDSNISVAGIDINTGYTGTITQTTGATVTVGSSNYTQYGGTFTGGDSTIDINGDFTLAGGTFIAPSGPMYISGDWALTSEGTFSFLPETEFLESYPRLKSGFDYLILEVKSENLIFDNKDGVETLIRQFQEGLTTTYEIPGTTIKTVYKEAEGISLATLNYPIKQAIIIENANSQDINLTLQLKHQINADSIYWDGKEYDITVKPRTFEAYMATEIIDPQDHDIKPEDLGVENLPTYSIDVRRGVSVTFYEKNGNNPALYNWGDIPEELNPQVTVLKEQGQSFMNLSFSVSVGANSTYVIDPDYDLVTSSNYNIRYDGAADYDYLGQSVAVGDVNGDSNPDLIMGAYRTDFNSRGDSGSVYVIYSTLLDDNTGTGTNLDLTTSTNYSIRYDGAAAGDRLGWSVAVGDVNGDSVGDLIMGAHNASNNSRDFSGSVYVIYSTLLDDNTGTGNILDLATSTNYNIRYDGVVTWDNLSQSVAVGDVNGDSNPDLIMGAYRTDFNSRGDSGSVYVIYSTLLDDNTGTGTNLDLTTSTNYNIRYDGAADSDRLGWSVVVGNVNGDSTGDLIMGAYQAGFNSRTNSGSVYVIYSTLLDDNTGTGNNLDLNTSTNYNIRYDGAAASGRLGSSVAVGNVNGDSNPDLIMGAYQTDNNSRTDSGSVYVIYSTLLDDNTGTGNILDIATSTNYNIRYDGAVAVDRLGYSVVVGDVNGDSTGDLIMGAYYAGNNSRSYSGSVYVIYSTLLDDNTGTGNILDIATSANYSIRYDGAVADDRLGSSVAVGDVNGDSINDFIMGAYQADNNSRTNSGSVYTVFGESAAAESGAEMASSGYRIWFSGISSGGHHQTSDSYIMRDTIGGFATGPSTSTNYKLKAGYQQMQEIYLSISSPSNVNMGSILGVSGGTATGEAAWTIITDNPAGYNLQIKASSSPALPGQSQGDEFVDYTEVSSGTPDYSWSIADSTAEFGFSPEGSHIVQKFKDNGSDTCNTGSNDTVDKCWYGFLTTNETIANSYSSNHPSGTATTVKLKSQLYNSDSVPNNDAGMLIEDTYQGTITVTATAN